MHGRYQLLLAEGSTSDADSIVSELGRAGLDVDVQRVATADDMEAALTTKPWDFVIFGEHLSGLDWRTALALCKHQRLDIPFIMVSGIPESDPGVDRIKAGVHEHLLKPNLVDLPQIVRRELRGVRERRIRQHAEAAARLLDTNAGCNQVGIIGLAADGIIVSWDRGAEKLFGYTASEMIGCSVPATLLGEAFTLVRLRTESENKGGVEAICRRKDASSIRVQIVPCPVQDAAERTIGTSVVVRDLAGEKAWSQVDLAVLFGSTTRSFPAAEQIPEE